MMNPTCDAEIRVVNENALRFCVFSRPPPVLEYIKSISSLVGASHILAVFEENDVIKVFFDEKRYVDSLVKSGIHVLGHHIRADYVVPPGTKIVLSNMDPVITNCDLIKLLNFYGTVVSPVIRPPISDDTEFCHIGYGLRYVYMELNGPLPEKLEFKYADQLYTVKVRLGDDFCIMPYIKRDDSEMNSSETDSSNVLDVTIANQPTVVDAYTLADNSGPIVLSVESSSSEGGTDMAESSIPLLDKASVNPKATVPNSMHLKRTRGTSTSRAARKIRQNFKRKWIGGRVRRMKSKPRQNPDPKPISPPLPSLSPAKSDVDNSKLSFSPDGVPDESKLRKVLSDNKLTTFIEDVKNKRDPLELAKKYVGDDSDVLYCLINQLKVFNLGHKDTSLKLRISRLIKTLKDAMEP